MFTLAEFGPDDALRRYRESAIASRLGGLDYGMKEQKTKICEGALASLGRMKVPGE